jgi:nucleoside-diphosphate-sugar epimerase
VLILITGASGRVGQLLVEELQVQHDLRLLQRGTTDVPWTGDDPVKVFSGSLLDAELVEAAAEGVDLVYHLAALMPPADNGAIFDTNVRGTFNVLEAIRRDGSRPRVVFASTDATYGTGWSKRAYAEPIAETVEPQPTNFYGSSKVLCEGMLHDYRRLYGLDYVVLRFSWIFAASEVLDLFSMKMWEEFMTNEQRERFAGSTAVPVLYEEDGTPFSEHIVDARDCARAATLAGLAETAAGETFNICSRAPFRYVDFSPRVAEALDRPLEGLPLEHFHGYSFDWSKASRRLGFEPRYDVDMMLEEALAGSLAAKR